MCWATHVFACVPVFQLLYPCIQAPVSSDVLVVFLHVRSLRPRADCSRALPLLQSPERTGWRTVTFADMIYNDKHRQEELAWTETCKLHHTFSSFKLGFLGAPEHPTATPTKINLQISTQIKFKMLATFGPGELR